MEDIDIDVDVPDPGDEPLDDLPYDDPDDSDHTSSQADADGTDEDELSPFYDSCLGPALADDSGRTTDPHLTKYECVRILGTRAHQLAMGAPPCIPAPAGADPLAVAVLELKRGRTPFIVRRPLPSGRSESWRVHELVRTPGDVPPIIDSVVPYYALPTSS